MQYSRDTNGPRQSPIGVLMLDSQFPRIRGDIGNPETWPFPVLYRVVAGASPTRAVEQNPRALLAPFIEAGQDLVAQGCCGIVTTCGFLTLLQDELRAALDVPVATSSLMQFSMVQALLPINQRPGILTISQPALTPAHLQAAGVPAGTHVVGTEGGRSFTRDILGDQPSLSLEDCRLDMLDAAQRLVNTDPQLGAIILECTNMAPYAAEIAEETGLPVFSVVTLVHWLHAGLIPQRFQGNPPAS